MSDQNSPEVLVPSEIYSPGEPHVIYVERPRQRYWLHILLLFATFFTTLVVGARLEWNFQHSLPPFVLTDSIFPVVWALQGRNLLLGIPFSLTLMGILLAHELGHYLYCVKYRVSATLPFFIPCPTLIGTLGAFIRIRSPLRSRSILFDIGIAGPIAGFVVALPVLFLSLGRSQIAPLGVGFEHIALGYPLIFTLVRKLLIISGFGGAIASVPLSRLYLHPVAIAAWVGMFATSLNLLPGGQLDGGHIVFAVSPRAHRTISSHDFRAHPDGAVFLDRMDSLGDPAALEWHEASRSRRMAQHFSRPPLARAVCADNARAYFRTRAHWAAIVA